jgi:glucose/arabinose dehydrogenase
VTKLVRTGIALCIVAVAGIVAFDRWGPDEFREGWWDCTRPQVQPLPRVETGREVPVDTRLVAEIELPTDLTDSPHGLLVSSLSGEVTLADPGKVILDLTDEVLVGAEQGLLNVELDPRGEWLYVSYTAAPDGESRIRAWRFDGDVLDPDDGVDIARLDQPHRWHNGGGIAFGPDGYLYASFGDGGTRDAQPPGSERARDLSSWYGTIVRIDPTPESGGYDVPPDNPFVGREDAAPEILHYGLRNPWRFSFDGDGEMWIADTGHYCWEEINVVDVTDAGVHFGWPGLEGTHEWAFEEDDGTRGPVFEYSSESSLGGSGCAVTGGDVYRGDGIPELQGAYVFADFCGGLKAIRYDGNEVLEHPAHVELTSVAGIVSDDRGRIYLLSMGEDGGVHELVAG